MDKSTRFFFLFEQSGTFKKQALRLGFVAFDVDIVQTDFVDYHIDLFEHIDLSFNNQPSFFDEITPNDIVIAFFPCIRFSCLAMHWLRGTARTIKDKDDKDKIDVAMRFHKELSNNYDVFCKLFLLADKFGFKLVVENPYTADHYLKSFFPVKPSVVISNRRFMGDYFVKPTQFFFYGFKPLCNVLLECVDNYPYKRVDINVNGFDRSMISPCFASQFLRSYVIPRELWEGFDFYGE